MMMFGNPQEFAEKAHLLTSKDGLDKLTSGFVEFHKEMNRRANGAFGDVDKSLSSIFGQMQAMKVCAALAEAFASAERFDKALMQRRRAAIGAIPVDAADTPKKASDYVAVRFTKVLTAELDNAGTRDGKTPAWAAYKAKTVSETLIPVAAVLGNMFPHMIGRAALQAVSALDMPYEREISRMGNYLNEVVYQYMADTRDAISMLDREQRIETLDHLPVTICGIYAEATAWVLPEVEQGIKVATAILTNLNARDVAHA